MKNTSSSDLCELFFFWSILPIKLCLSLSSLPPWVTSLFTPHPVPLLRNLRVTLPLLHPTAILDPSIASPSLLYCFSKGLMGPVLDIFRPSCWHQNGLFNMWPWSFSLLVCKPPMDSSPPCHSPIGTLYSTVTLLEGASKHNAAFAQAGSTIGDFFPALVHPGSPYSSLQLQLVSSCVGGDVCLFV